MAEQHQRRLVGPVHVVEHEHDRMRGRHLGEQIGDAVEQAEPLGVGVGDHRLGEPGDARAESSGTMRTSSPPSGPSSARTRSGGHTAM